MSKAAAVSRVNQLRKSARRENPHFAKEATHDVSRIDASIRLSWRIGTALLIAIATATATGKAQDSAGHVGGPGKFKVGHTTIQIVHESSTGERRPMDVMVWYPASTKEWQTATPSIYRPRLCGVPLIPGTWDPLNWRIAATLARDNVPIARGHKPFPLVIHSHANLLEPLLAAENIEVIASHGYVVTAPFHTGNTSDDARADLVNRTAGRPVLGCLDGLPTPCVDANVGKNIADRVLDLRAIMDNIDSFLGDHVDSSNVAVFGHSRGGFTALAAAGGSTTYGINPLGNRLKGLVAWSGVNQDTLLNVHLANVTTPTVMIASSGDRAIPTALVRKAYDVLRTADSILSNPEA